MGKGKLAGKILGIIIILILVGILESVLGAYMLRYYRELNEKLEETISQAYLTEKNQTFYYVNDDLAYMAYSDNIFERIRVAYSQTADTVEKSLEKTLSVTDLKNTFGRLANTYGTELNFFYYDNASDMMVAYGNNSYQNREEFLDYVREDIKAQSLPRTKEKKWFLYEGNYICTFIKGTEGYIGCWMNVSDFTDGILEMANAQCSEISLYDDENQQKYALTQNRDGSYTSTLSTEEKQGDSWRNLKYATFDVRIQLNKNLFTGQILLQIFFTLAIIIYLVVVVAVLLYVKKHILGQVDYFYNNLLEYSHTMRFNEESSIVEFAEAGKVLNQLADEINRLKIDVYEQQLEKQSIELDYAQLQIRPHFYINCLNVIYSMAQTGRTREIQEIGLQVSKYLRYIFKKNMNPVTLESELEFVNNYLKVQTSINGQAYELKKEVPEDLDDFALPPLMLQTFVENSIKYGDNPEGDFCVSIKADRENLDGKLFVRLFIEDTGMGFSEEMCERFNNEIIEVEDESYHIGIRNAIKRMHMLYGKDAHIIFGNSEKGGALIIMNFPVGENKDEHITGR